MTAFRRIVLAVVVGIVAVLGGAMPASGAPVVYGECEVHVIRLDADADADAGDRGGLLLVTVGNRGDERFGPVSVELWRSDRRVRQVSTGSLAPGASAVVRLPLSGGTAGAYLMVGYGAGGVRREFAVPVPSGGSATDAAAGGALLAWLTPLLGFVSALAGVWLGHVTTARRERARLAADAQWKRVDRDGPAYRDFLDYWQAGTSASHLESAFAQLKSAASVPAEVVGEYERTLGVLRDAGASEDAKRVSAIRLQEAIDALRSHRT